MLILSRRLGEALLLQPSEGIDPETTVSELFAKGPIEIKLLKHRGNQTKIGIEAPGSVTVVRDDVIKKSVGITQSRQRHGLLEFL